MSSASAHTVERAASIRVKATDDDRCPLHSPASDHPQPAHCHLCAFFGVEREAETVVTIPMAGHRPSYPLCAEHLQDVGAYVDELSLS